MLTIYIKDYTINRYDLCIPQNLNCRGCKCYDKCKGFLLKVLENGSFNLSNPCELKSTFYTNF